SSGVAGAHNHSWVHSNYSGSITIRTEKDYLTLDLVESRLSGKVDGKEIDFKPSEEEAAMNDHWREVDVFLEAVRTNDFSGIRSSYADATRSLEVAEAVNNTMAAGTPVQIKEA
ncbi:MAG: hypothetical protein AB3N33_06325, partial [Puniceicoccaceae bacterium]